MELASVSRGKVLVTLAFKVAMDSLKFARVTIDEPLDGQEALNAINDLLTLCFWILGEEDARYGKAKEEGFDKAIGLRLLPDITTLEWGNFDVAGGSLVGGMQPLMESVYRVIRAIETERVPLDSWNVVVEVTLDRFVFNVLVGLEVGVRKRGSAGRHRADLRRQGKVTA